MKRTSEFVRCEAGGFKGTTDRPTGRVNHHVYPPHENYVVRAYLKVVQRVQRIDAGHAADVQAQQDVPVVPVGVPDALPAQKEIGSERPGHPGTGRREHHHADGASFFRVRRHRQVFDVGLFDVYLEIAEETLTPKVSGPGKKKKKDKSRRVYSYFLRY